MAINVKRQPQYDPVTDIDDILGSQWRKQY